MKEKTIVPAILFEHTLGHEPVGNKLIHEQKEVTDDRDLFKDFRFDAEKTFGDYVVKREFINCRILVASMNKLKHHDD